MVLLTIIGVISYFAYLYWTEPCEYEDDEEKKEQNPYRILPYLLDRKTL